MMQTDVKSTHLSAAGSIFAGPSRLKGIVVAPAVSTAATYEVRDGGATGRIVFQMDIPTNSNPNSYYIAIPGEGILFLNGVYVSLPASTKITVFYA